MKKFLVAALFLAAVGCKKKDNESTNTPSRESLVGTYRQTGETTDGQNTWNTANYDPCEMDDTYALNGDGTFVQTDAGTVCAGSGGSVTGFWEINGSTFSINGFESTVQSFDGRTLVLRTVETGGGTTSTTVVTLVKQ